MSSGAWLLAATAVASAAAASPRQSTAKRAGAWIETWYALEGHYIWQPSLPPGTVGAGGAALEDINGDGLDDAVVWGSGDTMANGDATLTVSLSTGTSFTQPAQVTNVGCKTMGTDESSVAFGDATGDGRVDLLCSVPTKGFYVAEGSSSSAPWFKPLVRMTVRYPKPYTFLPMRQYRYLCTQAALSR